MFSNNRAQNERGWRFLNYVIVFATLISAGYLVLTKHAKSSNSMEQYKAAVQKFESNIYEKKLEVYRFKIVLLLDVALCARTEVPCPLLL